MSHILIVDDNPTHVELIKYVLRLEEGFRMSCGYSGKDALELAQRLKPDLIILDDKMPSPVGSEVVRRLRAIGDNVPILMLTNRNHLEEANIEDDEREIQCLKLGCDDFLFKPARPDLLRAHIQALLRRKGETFQLTISIKLRAIRAASSSHPVKAEQY